MHARRDSRACALPARRRWRARHRHGLDRRSHQGGHRRTTAHDRTAGKLHSQLMSIRSALIGAAALSIVWPCAALAEAAADAQLSGTPAAESPWPALLGEQYTFVLQHQTSLHSPYQGPLSLDPAGDTQPTNTIGFYSGWAPFYWAQLYFDTEKFMGAGVSNATGLGGLTNGDVVREGANNLPKEFYIARAYARFMLPLAQELAKVEAAQDQIGGTEAATRLEAKIGWLAVNDDFDKNL